MTTHSSGTPPNGFHLITLLTNRNRAPAPGVGRLLARPPTAISANSLVRIPLRAHVNTRQAVTT
ncbi:hypothetical protein ACFYSJ_31165 [Streptomyces sp. NPDC005248]|uniref:hypothetical protein n=1 Tax=Streptomyces sp. NPDC005248 TaxID=3364709 RepID=UPI00368F22A3